MLSQLTYHRQLSQAVGSDFPPVKYPKLGDRFEKYQIRSLLGEGGVARVYLATDDHLGRKVALKVSASFGQEPSILAKLDHRNIVPILTVAESESGLRGICMPYRPGVTLEDLIRRLGRGMPPRSARSIWKLLPPSESSEELGSEEQRAGWVGFPIEGTFSEAVAWIGLSLSHALSYLHGEGVLHRDIKPANVLLAYREGPQLLDFNLAQDPKAPEQVQSALKGGTIPYMAPEHLRAFLNPSGWEAVGQVADIYSLGLVLRELVTGRPPDLPGANLASLRAIQSLIDRRTEPSLPVREINPSVPPALESIISKCLAEEPSARYTGASDLAEDLKRFLDRLPLRHAPNTSPIERAANLVHRNRYAIVGSICCLLLFLSLRLLLTPTPVQNQPLFQRAVEKLDSRSRDDWKRAKLELEQIHERFPGSAWPLLYLGLVEEKLGDTNDEDANKHIESATHCPDAEAAFTHRLETDPTSPTVLTAQGMMFIEKKQFDRASNSFRLANRADPGRSLAALYLSKLDSGPNRHENAIRYLTIAIETGERRKTGGDRLYELRKAILPHFTALADSVIDTGPTERDRERANIYLERISATLSAMKHDLEMMMGPGGGELPSVYRRLLPGVFRFLQCRAHRRSRSDNRIRPIYPGSSRRFRSGIGSNLEGVKNHDDLITAARVQRDKVENRYQKFIRERENALPRPIGN